MARASYLPLLTACSGRMIDVVRQKSRDRLCAIRSITPGRVLTSNKCGGVTITSHAKLGLTPRSASAIVGFLTIANLYLRFRIASNGGLWRDEALFLAIVDLPRWDDLVAYLRLHESHPPLFFGIMRFWRKLFGQSDGVGLALPILIGTLIGPLTFLIGKRLFSLRTGLIAATLVMLAPGLNDAGSSVRPYGFLALLILTSFWLSVESLERGGAWRWVLYGFSLSLIAFTHNWGWLAVGGSLLGVLTLTLTCARTVHRRERLKGLSISLLALLIPFLPWFPALVYQTVHAGHSGVPVDSFSDAVRLVLHGPLTLLNATLLPSVREGRSLVMIAVLAALAILAKAHFRKQRPMDGRRIVSAFGDSLAFRAAVILVASATIVATLISPFSDMLPTWCLASLSPLLAILLAYVTDWAIDQRAHAPATTHIVQALAVVLFAVYATATYSLVKHPRSNVRDVVAAVARDTRPTDLIIIVPGWLNSSVNHYLRRDGVRQLAYPDGGGTSLFDFSRVRDRMRDPQRVIAVEHAIDVAKNRGTRVWLVSDAINLYPQTLPDSLNGGTDPWWALAMVRTRTIRERLVASFGSPVWQSQVLGVEARQEIIVAELFDPSDAQLR